MLGLASAASQCEENGLAPVLLEVQCCLQEVMSHVATPAFLDPDDDPDDAKVKSMFLDN